MSQPEIVALALDICLSLEHPMVKENPQLRDCATFEEVLLELRKIMAARN